jgi:quinolinate synthase
VHERFTPADIAGPIARPCRALVVLAHPECPPEVLEVSDFAGSTAAMADYVTQRRKPKRVVLITECSMADNVAASTPADRVPAALQPVPAHEADHPPEHLRRPALRRYEVTVDPASPTARAWPCSG